MRGLMTRIRIATFSLTVGMTVALVGGCGGNASTTPTKEEPKDTVAAKPPTTQTPAPKPTPPPPLKPEVVNVALGAKATASTTRQGDGDGAADAAIDGNAETHWSSESKDRQEIVVDLGSIRALTALRIVWNAATPKRYEVSLSNTGKGWAPTWEWTDGGAGPRTDDLELGNLNARWVRLRLFERATDGGFSINEIEILGFK